MTKHVWGFVTDPHLRNYRAWGGEQVAGVNARARRVLAVLRESVEIARAAGATDFAVLGDVFDQANPLPQLVAGLAQVVRDASADGLEVHLLVGNHDMVSEERGDHALAPLAYVYGCRVHDRPSVEGGVLFCPYRRGAVKDWLPAELERGAADGAVVLAAHFGIITEDTPPFLRGATDAAEADWLDALLEEHNFAHAFLGNWHNPARSKYATQLGTICPHGFGDVEPGHVGFYADEFASSVTLDDPASQPKFKTVRHGDAMAADPGTYLRVTGVPREELADVRRWFDKFVSDGHALGVEVEAAAKGDGLVAHEAVLPTMDRDALVDRYVERTFGAEPPETRAALLQKLREYGVRS